MIQFFTTFKNFNTNNQWLFCLTTSLESPGVIDCDRISFFLFFIVVLPKHLCEYSHFHKIFPFIFMLQNHLLSPKQNRHDHVHLCIFYKIVKIFNSIIRR